jgi:hypothetical protein
MLQYMHHSLVGTPDDRMCYSLSRPRELHRFNIKEYVVPFLRGYDNRSFGLLMQISLICQFLIYSYTKRSMREGKRGFDWNGRKSGHGLT